MCSFAITIDQIDIWLPFKNGIHGYVFALTDTVASVEVLATSCKFTDICSRVVGQTFLRVLAPSTLSGIFVDIITSIFEPTVKEMRSHGHVESKILNARAVFSTYMSRASSVDAGFARG